MKSYSGDMSVEGRSTLSDERLDRIMEATNEIIWLWNIKTGVVKRSRALKEKFGYNDSSNLPVESFWLTKVVKEDRKRVLSSLFKVINDPCISEWEETYRFKRSDGKIAQVVDRAYVIRDSNGEAIEMVGSVMDETEKLELIQALNRQNDKLKEIAWEQAHLVCSPLARLKGLVQLMDLKSFDVMNEEMIWRSIKLSTNELDSVMKRIQKKIENNE